jgi:hypothetical protein
VHVTVYRTRQRGIRLPAPAAGVRGHLELGLWRLRSTRQLAARLTSEHDASSLLLPELLPASVERITRNGIVIAGTEVVPRRAAAKSTADRYPQTWWCLVHPVSLAECDLDALERLGHSAAGLRR